MFKSLLEKPKKSRVYGATAIMGIFGCACLCKDRVCGNIYPKENRAEDKIVIITGANSGIGQETALGLARRGAKIYMACRNLRQCEKAREKIVLDTKNKYVYCRPCDLASLDSIREFVKIFKKEQKNLHILINNAGVMRPPKGSQTKDGFELQFGVNHLGHFLLTNLLLDSLKSSAPSRIINVSSIVYEHGKINKDDINSEKNYNPKEAYAQSKLANVLFNNELAEKLKGTGVTVNAVNPGIATTKLTRHMSFYSSWISTIFLKPFMWPFVKSPRYASQTILYLALDPEVENVTGKYFSDYKEVELKGDALDKRLSQWIWQLSEKWTRLNN